MTDTQMTPTSHYFNRELSWLAFNMRVLEEAQNTRHPLLERVRFLSICASNMDEFYMVRVAGLKDLVQRNIRKTSQDGQTPKQQLRNIHAQASTLMQHQQDCWDDIRTELAAQSIDIVDDSSMIESEKSWLREHCLTSIFPALTPISIEPTHPFPFLPNQSMAAIYDLRKSKNKKGHVIVLPLPAKLERFITLPSSNGTRIVMLETVLDYFIQHLFPTMNAYAKGYVRIIRDSDLDISEDAEDLVRSFERAVKERRRGSVVRLKINNSMPTYLRRFLCKELDASQHEVVEVSGMLGLSHVSELCSLDRPDLLFNDYIPRLPERINDFDGDCFAAIRAKDILVHHPYESFDVVVRFLEQAARDPEVVAIKQTLYRTSNESPIVAALIEAAESGKAVTAVVELRARFDEEANIRWARDLERAGAQVVYGIAHMKTHAKISLVTRHYGDGLESFVHFGTGNYHPITAKIYTDLSFFTCDPALCFDAAQVFNYVTGYAAPSHFQKLAMSPMNLRDSIKRHIDQEIAHAKQGKPAHIWAKMNALLDKELIDALYQASQAGVKIELVVRGVCSLRPNVKGLSDNIRVTSMIGRFLEHSRIYCFGNGEPLPSAKAKVFIASADLMPRNLDRRVECLIPIENETVHEQVLGQIMGANIEDDLQSWELQPDGSYQRLTPHNDGFCAHDYFMHNPSLSGRGSALTKSPKPERLYHHFDHRKGQTS